MSPRFLGAQINMLKILTPMQRLMMAAVMATPQDGNASLSFSGDADYIEILSSDNFDLSDEQIEVIHDHYDIDPDLVNRLTLQLILTSMLGQMRNNSITDEG